MMKDMDANARTDAVGPHVAHVALAQGVADRRGLLVSRLALELLERITPHLEALGIDGRDYLVLAVLSADDMGSQAELANLCTILPTQLVPMLDELESAGLVERSRDPKDRRRMIVRLTSKGRGTLAKADASARTIEEELLAPLDDQTFTRLADSLRTALR
jgi:DNA-binding MarR family transcriptional regulator